MKYILSLIVSILVSIVTATAIEVTLDGHASVEYGSDRTADVQNSLHFGDSVSTTIWPIIKVSIDEQWSLTMAAELSDSMVTDSNWLKNLFIQYSPEEELTFKFGRICTTGIMLTQPLRFLETVRYQACPVGIYGYGAQVIKTNGNWNIMADVTTDTDESFRTFNGLESGVRVQYNFNKQWFLAGNVVHDFTDETTFAALDLSYESGPFGFHLVGYTNDEDTAGVYTLAKYRVCTPLEIHVGLDVQDSGKFDEIIGLRLFADEKTDVTVDYTHSNFVGQDENLITARLRYRF